MRFLKKPVGVYTLSTKGFDLEGNSVDVTGPVTASMVDGGGLPVTVVATPSLSSGSIVWNVEASAITRLDSFTVTWTGTVAGVADSWQTTFETVGGFHFSLAALRAKDRAFLDTAKFPTATLAAVRDAVEDVIEGPKAASVAFVPRGRRFRLNGRSPELSRGYHPLMYGADYRSLFVPDFEVRCVYGITVDGVALTSDELAGLGIDDNEIARNGGVYGAAWPHGRGNIVGHYAHGRDVVPPAINRASLILAREYLSTTELPGRATATSIGDQMFRLTIAGRDGVTGLPEVDAAIAQHGRTQYGIG